MSPNSTTPRSEIEYRLTSDGVDWVRLRETLAADQFDNGRNPEQLRRSFEASAVVAIASAGQEVIGTARALSDGVCNAYVIDVWTLSAFRRRGVASAMIRLLLSRFEGQHVYLFTDDAVPFCEQLGFHPNSTSLGRVVGKWLQSGLPFARGVEAA